MKCVVLKTRWVITSVFGMGMGSGRLRTGVKQAGA